MKNLFTGIFPLLVLALLIALTSSGSVYALSSHESSPTRLSTFNRSFGLWVVNTESEFNNGVLNNVDTSSSPGDVKCGSTNLTTTYYYSDLPASPHDAYYCDEDSAPPPVLDEVTEATTTQYEAISASDDSRWVTPDPGNKDTVFMWFNVIIDEAPASITNIDLVFEGHCVDTTTNFRIYAYNNNAPGWEQIGTSESIPSNTDETVTRSITSDFGNYIDGSGKLQWGIGDSACTRDQMRVDYSKVDVTYTGDYSSGTIASSVNDTSEGNAGWDLLGWDKTLPAGTDITFEVRASDTIFLKGDGTPAWQDASVLPTGRYQQWRATLTTTDSANTPVLHEVWDLYSW